MSHKKAQYGHFVLTSFSFAMLKNYFVVASRSLYRQKYFTIVNIIGLAIGMSVSLLFITMYTFVNTYDDFHVNKGHVYRVTATYNKGEDEFKMASAPAAMAEKLKSEMPDIEKITRISSNYKGEAILGSSSLAIRGYYVDPEFLSIFSFELAEGNIRTALEKPMSIVITQSTAKKLFGDTPALGNALEIANQGTYEVTGILKNPPINTHMKFESLVSYSTLPHNENKVINYESAFSYGTEFVYFLLQDETELGKIEIYLDKLAREISRTSNANISYQVESLNDITPSPAIAMLTGGLGPRWDMGGFYVLGTICLLILLPACFNYTNISIARAFKRAKEIGLRKTMGGQRNQIFLQFIAETVVVTTISLAGALLLFFAVRKEFQSTLVFASSLDLSLKLNIVGLFLLFAIVTGFLAGAAPALYFAKLNPIQALKSQSGSRIFSGMWLRKGLTVFQFILSFGFIVALIVFSRQYRYTVNYDFGFDRKNILDVQLQNIDHNLFVSEYSKLASVHDISFSSGVLGILPTKGHVWMKPESKSDSISVTQQFVDHRYVQNLNLKFLSGSNFSDEVWSHERI